MDAPVSHETPELLGHYRSRAVRALVRLHDQRLRDFLHVWQAAKAADLPLPLTDDPHYRSLDHLLHHVFESAGAYLTRMCTHLGLPDPAIEPPAALADGADAYLDQLLAHWRQSLADVTDAQTEPEVYVPGMQYWIDAMLEHAVMHPIRHEFQLRELMASEQSF